MGQGGMFLSERSNRWVPLRSRFLSSLPSLGASSWTAGIRLARGTRRQLRRAMTGSPICSGRGPVTTAMAISDRNE